MCESGKNTSFGLSDVEDDDNDDDDDEPRTILSSQFHSYSLAHRK